MLGKRYPRGGRECVAIYTITGCPHQHPYIACMLRGAVHEYVNVCCSECLGRIAGGPLWLRVLRAKPNVGSIAMPNEARRVERGRDQMILEDGGSKMPGTLRAARQGRRHSEPALLLPLGDAAGTCDEANRTDPIGKPSCCGLTPAFSCESIQ